MTTHPLCPYCERHHDPRYFCDPAKVMVAELHERAARNDIPTTLFKTPIDTKTDARDRLMTQFTVKAGLIDVGGVMRPVVMIGGKGEDGRKLPAYVYTGTVTDMQKAREIFDRMVDAAITQAEASR